MCSWLVWFRRRNSVGRCCSSRGTCRHFPPPLPHFFCILHWDLRQYLSAVFFMCVALPCVSDGHSFFPVRLCKLRSQAAGMRPLGTQSCLLILNGGCRRRGCWGGTGNTSGYYRTPCSPSNPTNRRPRSMRRAPSPNLHDQSPTSKTLYRANPCVYARRLAPHPLIPPPSPRSEFNFWRGVGVRLRAATHSAESRSHLTECID